MAISTDELTVKASDIMSRPLRQRQEMANRGLLDVMLSTLTPGQIAATFPSYIKDFTTGGPSTTTAASIAAFRGRAGAGTGPTGSYPNAEGKYTGPPPDRRASNTARLPLDKSKFTQREQAVLDMIARREGSTDPNIIFGDVNGRPGSGKYSRALGLDKKPLTEMTIAEVLDMQDKLRALTSADGIAGRIGTSAVGSGQMLEGTLRDNLTRLGIKPEDYDKINFDATLQAQLTLSNFRASIGDPNADPSTWDKTQLGIQYESFNVSKGFAPLTTAEVEFVRQAAPEIAETTATPIGNNAETPSDYVINYPRVVQEHIETADVRKLKLDEDLEKRIAWAADSLSNTVLDFENDNGYRNFEWVSKSGGQDETTGIPPGATKEGHWDGKASDGYLVEIMPDGSRRTVTLDDEIVMGQFAEYLGQAGIKEVGGGYKGMGPNQLHLGTSGDSGVYSPEKLPDYITERYNEGREFSKDPIRVKEGVYISFDKIIDDRMAELKQELQASREQNKTTQPIANPAASVVPQETIQAPNNIPAAAAAAIESQTNPTATPVPVKPAAPQPIATTPQTPQMIASLTGTSLLPDGAKAAAGGAEIDKPYFAQPVDGAGPNILMGETGPETITPRHRADDFGIQSYQMQQMPAPEPAMADIVGSQNIQQPQYLPKPSFAQEPRQTPIVAEHTPIPPSLRKQYADAKMQNRLDNLSPIGSVYSNFGYA